MSDKRISILGTEYKVLFKSSSEETMVDWFAIQFPKIHKVYKELGIEGD